jgi:esterase/lipase superfamily enzyme
MQLLVFGHGGEPVIVFPTSCGRFYQWEDFGMTGALHDKLVDGRVQLFCIDSVDEESFYAKQAPHAARIARDDAYDRYVLSEVVPFVRHRNDRPITLAGTSFGAYHAVDKGLRHPDVYAKILAMSGAYDLRRYLEIDESAAYLRLPLAYLPALKDAWFLDHIRRQRIVLTVGDQDFLLGESCALSDALGAKGLPATLDVWTGYPHDWPAWREMVKKHVG